MLLPLDPLALCTAGFTAVLVGLGLLVWPWKQPEHGWRVPLVAGLALSGVGTGLAAGRADAWVVGPTLSLGAIGLLLTLLRSRLIARLSRVLAGPLLQAAVLLTVGVGLLAVGAYGIDRETQRDLDDTDRVFGEAWYRRPVERAPRASARTDEDRVIVLHAPIPGGDNTEARPTDPRGSGAHVIQTGPPDPRFNCHGWVFTGGLYLISGRDVELILEDNGYQEVKAPRAGDVAIFRDTTGFATHTALVCGVGDRGMVLLESKWGQGGRFIHTATDHPYSQDAVRYYRTGRGAHQLAGLKAAPPEIGAAE